MAFKRTNARRGFRRGYGKKYPINIKTITKIAHKAAKNEITKRIETHYIDTAQATITCSSAGVISSQLSTITQGTTDSSRIGDRVTIKSIKVKGNLIAADATQVVRVILFQWLQDTASCTPIPSDILQNQNQPYSPLSSYTKDSAGYEWVPLWDRTFCMNAGTGTSVNFSVKLSGKKLSKGKAVNTIQFNAAGTTGTGHYYFCFYSDSGAAFDPTFTYYSRIRYYS